jgi:hypothetical protein
MKLKLFFLLVAVICSIISCKKVEEDKSETLNEVYFSNGVHQINIRYTFKSDDVVIVKFLIESSIVDSLRVPSESIMDMCIASLVYSSYQVNYRPTYIVNKEASLLYLNTSSEFVASVRGTALNGFGVRGNVYSSVYFDRTFKMAKYSDGSPKIYTY